MNTARKINNEANNAQPSTKIDDDYINFRIKQAQTIMHLGICALAISLTPEELRKKAKS